MGVDFCIAIHTLLQTPEFSVDKVPRLPSSIISKPIKEDVSPRQKDVGTAQKDDDEDANENDDNQEMEGPER